LTDFSPAFLGMFESLRMGPTFARGRRDERAGHVRSLTISGSLVVALVRGPEDPTAFRARIAVRSFGASEWARVEQTLVAEARYVADLLDGRMPPGIEAVFAGAGLSPLPLSLDEVAMDCTCQRWPMPCAHLAATCYALARAFESDPFEVFTWRGRPRDELLMRLRRLREASAVDASRTDGAAHAGGDRAGGHGAGGDGAASGHGAGGDGSGGRGAGDAGRGGARAGDGGQGGGAGAGRSSAAADVATFWGVVVTSEPSGEAKSASSVSSSFYSSRRRRGQGERGAGDVVLDVGGAVLDTGGVGREGGGVGGDGGDPVRDGSSVRDAGGVGGDGGDPVRDRSSVRDDGGVGSDAGVAEEWVEAGSSGSEGGADGRGRGLRPDALLDQLDAPGLTHAGQPVTEVLRVAYLALPDAGAGD
jgi:hypothetical protein